MKHLLLKILLKLLRIPPVEGTIDKKKEREFFWGLYPTKEFRNYISKRDLELLQILGEGVSREDYLTYLGQRVELGMLLKVARTSFETIEKERKGRQNK